MTTTSVSPALIAEMRRWLADLTSMDLSSGDVLDADVVDAVDRLYAGGVSAFVLASEMAADAGPSDSQLLMELGLVLRACAGPVLGPRLSTLVAHVCHAYCPAATADERAERLDKVLAGWLNEHRVLRERQISVAGLDEWAAGASVVFLRAAVCACGVAKGGEVR